jgi:6-phosphofructokinase
VASTLGQVKSKEARKEAVEYLRKQGIELVERRGGDQSKLKKKKTKNK